MHLKKALFPASVFAGIAVLFLDVGHVFADPPAADATTLPTTLAAQMPATMPAAPTTMPAHAETAPMGRTSRIIDNAIPNINPDNVPPRPAPIIELGNPFFGTGKIAPGLELPGGAVWSPTFIIFGQFQSVLQGFENPAEEAPGMRNKPRTEWANRLDLYGNLQLTGSERVLIGVRPLDDGEFASPKKARYSGYNFGPEGTEGGVDAINPRITTLFFEGDFGQLFPDLDPFNTKQLDIGFSIGRQPLLYQDGIFINDDMDAVGITRNNFLPPGGANLQLTAVYAWGQINRGDGINHDDPGLLGFFVNADIGKTTWNLDTAYVIGEGAAAGDGAYAALSATQNIGDLNTTFRIMGSKALESHVPAGNTALSELGNGSSAVGNGVLLFSEVSWIPSWTKDLVYIDGYWGIDRFTSAARGPDRGGALGRVGILFAEQPIGRYGSALSSDPERSVGGVIGYQKFLDTAQRQQLILELGGRASTDNSTTNSAAVGARYQQAFGQHIVLQFDAFTALNESRGIGYGGRAEFRLEF